MYCVALSKLKEVLARFSRSERGSASIESLFWVPVFAFLLVLVADTSFIFYGKAQALRTIQDGNRALSTGRLDDEAAVQTYVSDTFATFSTNATVSTSINAGIISTTMTVPANDLVSVGSIPGLQNLTIEITAQQFMEQ